MITRRELLAGCAAGAAVGCLSAEARGGDALDEALRLLGRRGPQSRHGLSTHAPMVAEALCALGYPERAVAWVEADRGFEAEAPPRSARIDRAKWREALGPRPGSGTWESQLPRYADWVELFEEELKEGPWRRVVKTWVPRLAPGLCAAATHGVIRTGHIVRALVEKETPERRAELARALGYWAAAYQELPAKRGGQVGSYEAALARLPLHWEKRGKRPDGNIVEGLKQAGQLEGFAEARDLVVPGDLSQLTATFARVWLTHGTQHDSIAFVHAITGPAALRRLATVVSPETARAALPWAWQAAAGIYAAYARKSDVGPAKAATRSPKEIAARAVDRGAAHGIKLVEVLLAEHAVSPDPAYLAAAEDAANRLGA